MPPNVPQRSICEHPPLAASDTLRTLTPRAVDIVAALTLRARSRDVAWLLPWCFPGRAVGKQCALNTLINYQPLARRRSASPRIVLQKSPRRGCRIEIRNNRIEAIELLNQCCARMSKIVLQHNPSISRHRSRRLPGPVRCQNRTRAPQQKPDYSITSSARASSIGGTSRPSALAALRLITSSNREDCTTGHRGHAGGRSRSAHSRTASLK
jgi:hypothetical protein